MLIAFLIAHAAIPIAVSQSSSVQFDIYVDAQFIDSQTENVTQASGMEQIVANALSLQQLKGYYLAELDSVSWNASKTLASIYISNGPHMLVEEVTVDGISEEEKKAILALMDTKVEQVLSSDRLDADIGRIIRFYEEEGYPFTKVSVREIRMIELMKGGVGIDLDLQIEVGERVRLNDIVIVGARRTRQAYLEYLMGLEKGNLLIENLDEVRNKIIASGYFLQVGTIELIKVGVEEYIAVVQVSEDVPGAFDLVLGYQPPANNTSNGGVVGNGHLDLRNMFGMGRRISLRLNRLPGQISTLDALYADSYFWGSALSIEGGFQGLQQDSTYNQQSYRAALGYRLFDGMDIFATINREVVRPGQSGIELLSGKQRIARSDITFWGFSIRYRKLDSPTNPRMGIHLESSVEGGRKQRTESELVASDTTVSTRRLQQQRLNLSVRGFVPILKRQSLVFGNDTRILVSDDFDTSDLFRLGGAQSLRGYDEDRFRGRTVSRALIEWRYLFERTSYAYLFFDLGFVDRPQTPDFSADRNVYPGYGLGMQFQTGIGLVNTSLALSTQDAPSQAKVHVGLSLGL